MSLRRRIIELLEDYNNAGLIEIAHEERAILRNLISLAYDKESLICWRAIEAIGLFSGEITKKDPGKIRNLVGRLLWTIREESGGIGWSAPEIIGEIVRNSPEEFQDIAPIIASFYEEDMLRKGVLRALVRISEVRPDLVDASSALIKPSLAEEDPLVRAYAVMLAGNLRSTEHLSHIKSFINDTSVIRIYTGGNFRTISLGKIVEETGILSNLLEN